MDRLIAVLAAFGLAASGLTYLLTIGFPQQRYLKYATPVLCLLGALYFFTMAPNITTEGFKRLGYVVYGMMALGCFVVSLATAMYLEWRAYR